MKVAASLRSFLCLVVGDTSSAQAVPTSTDSYVRLFLRHVNFWLIARCPFGA